MSSTVDERELDLDLTRNPRELCGALRTPGGVALLLEGGGSFDEGWGPLVAVDPGVVIEERAAGPAAIGAALTRIDQLAARRRARGGPRGCGLAVLVAYDFLDPAPVPSRADDRLPDLVALAVDASVTFPSGGAPLLSTALPADGSIGDRVTRAVFDAESTPAPEPIPSRSGPLRSGLPREAYLQAVDAVREHIRRGAVYQANLTQRFDAQRRRDPFDLHCALALATPAPRAAYVETPSFALASASPETFLRVDRDGRIETWPIKGTRRRGVTTSDDEDAARGLERSEKDRAELVMIVDVERNDLGRVCRTGSVRVSELGALRSYTAVHHLVARVEGTLREGIGIADLLAATFPGGSITGAPKSSAMRILRALEPVRRSFYTGSLLWLGDDGRIESSILIRSVVMPPGRALVGAGGGVVWDSDPDAEWRESCDKARAILRTLGYEPEEAC